MRRLILVFNLLAPVAAVALLFSGRPWQWALGLLMLAHALWLWATLVPGSAWWGPILKRLPTREKEVWITIDDGPDPEDTPALLDLLDAHQAKATFFVIGRLAERHPHLVQSILDRGHEVGNHTYHHDAAWFWFHGRGKLRGEIRKGSGIIRRIAPDYRVRWFRAPAGLRNHHVHPILEGENLKLAGWSVRGRDGVSRNVKQITTRLRNGIAPGAILLMHEGRTDDLGKRLAPQVLEILLKDLKEQGYSAVLPTV